jgi:hypothetical protein
MDLVQTLQLSRLDELAHLRWATRREKVSTKLQ